jgi:hypothetical protein
MRVSKVALRVALVLALTSATVVLPPSARSDEAPEARSRQIPVELRSSNASTPPDEPWQTIPWKVSIVEARREALEDKRPLLMLSRSGHPLGCT